MNDRGDTAWDMIFWMIIISFIFSFSGTPLTGVEKYLNAIGDVLMFGFFFLIKAIEKKRVESGA